MGRALSVIRTAVRKNIEEPTANYWSNANIDKYINEGIRALNRKSKLLVSDPTSLSLVADQIAYSLASDCAGPHRIIRVQDDSGNEIQRTDLFMMRSTSARLDPKDDDVDSGTNPIRWYQLGRKIAFYAKPNYNETGGIEYWYLKTAEILDEDADVSPFSDEEDDLVEFYATGRALIVGQDIQRASVWFALYNAGAEEFVASISSPLGGEATPPMARNQEAMYSGRRRHGRN